MYRPFKRRRQIRRAIQRRHSPSQKNTADIVLRGDKYVIRVGDIELFYSSIGQHAKPRQTYDFAALAVAAISMAKNIEVDLDFPITSSMSDRLHDIARVYGVWTTSGLSPLRVRPTHVEQPTGQSDTSSTGIICFSGGLDSLSAAVEAKERYDLRDALLIAGADYDSADDPAFIELRTRVERLTDFLGLNLKIIATNFHMRGIHWGMTHGFNLGASLHFCEENHGFGIFAQDYTWFEEQYRGLWGNYGNLPILLSTDGFGIKTLGADKTRMEKLQHVADYDSRLLSNLSVCFSDKSSGGNCGKCFKCLITRVGLINTDVSEQDVFQATPDLIKAFNDTEMIDDLDGLRGRMVRCADMAYNMPDGALRDAVNKLLDRMTAHHLKVAR